jgi:hypothetical protein
VTDLSDRFQRAVADRYAIERERFVREAKTAARLALAGDARSTPIVRC